MAAVAALAYDLLDRPAGKVLDIGVHGGFLAHLLVTWGHHVVGIEKPRDELDH